MLEIVPVDTPTLGDRSYLVHDGRVAFVIDPTAAPDLSLPALADAGHLRRRIEAGEAAA